MKRLLFTFLFLVGFVQGQVSVSTYIEMSFPSYVWHNINEGFYRSPVKSERCDSCFNLDIGEWSNPLFYTAIDTNVFFVNEAELIGLNSTLNFTFWILSTATHPFSEILRDEFSRFQECGYITLTKERLDLMLDTVTMIIDSVLKEYPKGFLYNHNCYGNDELGPCAYNPVTAISGNDHINLPDSLVAEIARQNEALSKIHQRSPIQQMKKKRHLLFDSNGKVYSEKKTHVRNVRVIYFSHK